MEAREFILRQIDKAIVQNSDEDNARSALSRLQSSNTGHKLTANEIEDSCMEMLFSSVEGK